MLKPTISFTVAPLTLNEYVILSKHINRSGTIHFLKIANNNTVKLCYLDVYSNNIIEDNLSLTTGTSYAIDSFDKTIYIAIYRSEMDATEIIKYDIYTESVTKFNLPDYMIKDISATNNSDYIYGSSADGVWLVKISATTAKQVIFGNSDNIYSINCYANTNLCNCESEYAANKFIYLDGSYNPIITYIGNINEFKKYKYISNSFAYSASVGSQTLKIYNLYPNNGLVEYSSISFDTAILRVVANKNDCLIFVLLSNGELEILGRKNDGTWETILTYKFLFVEFTDDKYGTNPSIRMIIDDNYVVITNKNNIYWVRYTNYLTNYALYD